MDNILKYLEKAQAIINIALPAVTAILAVIGIRDSGIIGKVSEVTNVALPAIVAIVNIIIEPVKTKVRLLIKS